MDALPEDRLAHLEQAYAALTARLAVLERPRVAPRVPVPEPVAITDLESRLGTYWLSRLGIVSLITGAALLIITYFGALGAVLRIGLGYAMAAALIALGWRLSKRHEAFGRVVLGGGLAIAYFVTYALHFVPAMRMVDSEPVGVALVAIAIACVVATAHRLRSETVAGIALFLGLHTGMLADVTVLSLVCTTLLAAGAGFFLAANRWVIVPLSTVLAVYSTHAHLAIGGAIAPELSVAFVGVDFALFAVAATIPTDVAARSLGMLALLNWLGALLLGAHALQHAPDALCGFLGALAGAHVVLAIIAHARGASRPYVGLLATLALVTAALALPVRLDGWPLLAGWLVLALAAAVVARRAAWPAFGWLALAILATAQAYAHDEIRGAAALVACLLAGFAVERVHARGDVASWVRWLLVAFVATVLIQLGPMLVPPHLDAIAWIGASALLFATGFALRSGPYRWAAFGVLAVAAVRFFAVQLRVLSAHQRILTFLVAGAVLLLASFVYTRARPRPPASR